ncbi:phosphoadenosine phosphosulfate reductase family protein [Paenibacillus polymyxa]|uniref:phosphoadenosine phosphosulfate reductase family protein n=1 Tax=Paenibacillus polymyxa TaxID=1406 RepID=UPI002AB3C549|nr:phosphoadenosine phosphosulfate reductase family protein [Paenibacillus polymyxa]MDY7990668.1 phosphoadenosine phosphosulfate reductase family protein [Paenibacillus polymyxa]MDY8117521.1 phosphoadenosine phosphosulfate reductase family protein [Paenibacillus polymyxa]
MEDPVNIISLSGGKDSTALWLLAYQTLEPHTAVFADTGNEHQQTYEYIDYLEREIGPIRRIKADFSTQIARKREWVQVKWREEGISETIIEQALSVLHPTGNPFLDMCIWKGRFPSTKARFCTVELKVRPFFDQVYLPLLEEGKRIVSWQGIRAQESLARSQMPEREETPEGYEIYRPLINWTVEDVFAMHAKHNIEPNPLYKLGMGRVGCMPCINAGKMELFEIARRFPEEVERIAQWEEIVKLASKRNGASFFASSDGEQIWDKVEWSKTVHGGKQLDLFKALAFEDVPVCSSQYGLCE